MKVPIKRLPHRNARKETKSYIRMIPSVLEDFKTKLQHMIPREAVNKSYNDAGGVFKMSTCSEADRNRDQAYNLKTAHLALQPIVRRIFTSSFNSVSAMVKKWEKI